jgi:hypothetical protein
MGLLQFWAMTSDSVREGQEGLERVLATSRYTMQHNSTGHNAWMQRGRVLELLKELRQLKSESGSMRVDGDMSIPGRFATFPANYYLWLYKLYLCGPKTVDDTITQLELKFEDLSQEVEALSSREHQSTGNAVIIFNYVADAANMLYDHNLRNVPANLFVPSFIGRSFNIATKGRLAKTNRMILKEAAADRYTHRHVTVTRAPEPSDFMWENTQYGGWPIMKRRILAWVRSYIFALGSSHVYSL